MLVAENGSRALELARTERPDLITLDLSMPGQDGGKVYHALKSDAATRELKVCIVTGKPELRKLIYDRDVPPPDGYLDKPVAEDTLILNARKILELAGEAE